MTDYFQDSISHIALFEIKTKRPLAEETTPELFAAPLFKLTELISARDPNKRFFSNISENALAQELQRIVTTVSSIKGDATQIGIIKKLIRSERSLPKLVLYYKIIEEIAIRAYDERVWRYAMDVIGRPLYSDPMRIDSVRLDVLSIACLRNIRERCEGDKKTLAIEILGRGDKHWLACEIISGAVFTGDEVAQRKLAREIFDARSDAFLATLIAYQSSGLRYSESVHRALLLNCSGELQGSIVENGLVPAPTDCHDPEILEAYFKISAALARILTVKPDPHPWFLENVPPYGIAIPRLGKNGIQMSAFRALMRLPEHIALATFLDGWSRLIVPHYSLADGTPKMPRHITGPFAETTDMLTRLFAATRAITEDDRQILGSILFAKPWQITAETVSPDSLLPIAPVFGRILDTSLTIGAETNIPRIAGSAFIRGITGTRNDDVLAIMPRLDQAIKHEQEIFRISNDDSRERTAKLMQRLASKSTGQDATRLHLAATKLKQIKKLR